MDMSIHPTGCFRPSGRSILATMVFASLISGATISPVFAEDHGSERGAHGDRGRHDDRGRHGDRRWHDDRGWHDGAYYGYAQPVYAPPPVYVQPYQSPGINLILPIHIR